MARSLAASLVTDTARRVTTPGYLCEINFATPLRLSTRGDQTYGGNLFLGGRLGKVEAGEGGGVIELLNADLAASALVLGEGIADRPVTVWEFHADNPTDVVQVFAGVCDSSKIGMDRVSVRLAPVGRRTQYSPRRFVNAASGFTTVMPAGTRVSWGGQVFVIERQR